MMQGRAPTAEEKKWMDASCEVGCIVCRMFNGVYSPAEPHHIDGKTKPGAHLKTIPLCPRHHRIGGDGWETRHVNKARFEKEYGDEEYLLERAKHFVGAGFW